MDTQDLNEVQPGEPTMRVFDLPLSITAEDAEQMLNDQCERGLYLSGVVAWPGYGVRVFMRRYAKPTGPANTVNKEARAMQFLRDNREMTAKELTAAFKALGFVRSEAWVSKKRADVVRAERRIS
jgi:hypothetical protein